MKFLIFIFMFFVLSALLIISNNNLGMLESENIEIFSTLYFDWINGFYNNLQFLTGNIVGLDWVP